MLGSELKAGHIMYFPTYYLEEYNEELDIFIEHDLTDVYWLLAEKKRPAPYTNSNKFKMVLISHKDKKKIPSSLRIINRYFSRSNEYRVADEFKLTKKRVNNMVLHLSPVEIKRFLKVYHGGNTKAR